MRLRLDSFSTPFFCLLTLAGAAVAFDNIPPTGQITRPLAWSVLTSNTVRVAAEAQDAGSGIKTVEFFAGYSGANRGERIEEKIGVDSIAPYEILWDCSKILDQDATVLNFYCKVKDSAGNEFNSRRVYATLDRNPGLSPQRFVVPQTNAAIRIDGVLESEWTKVRPIEMRTDETHYQIYSRWDIDFLYLAAKVRDRYIYSRFLKMTASQKSWDSTSSSGVDSLQLVWLDDCISFFFDVNASRIPMLEPENRMLYVAPTGVYLAWRNDLRSSRFYNWGKEIRCNTKVTEPDTGALSRDSSGYTVELAIPWRSLGIAPKAGIRMGFQIFVVDRESKDRPRINASWSGQPHNHGNPSEWGTMVLEGGSSLAYKAQLALVGIIGVLGIFLFLRRRRASTPLPDVELTLQQRMVKDAEKYFRENFGDDSINREKVAQHLNISSAYLSEIFKKNTQKTIPQYLNELRIAKAKDLLMNTNQKITEIAFEVGFGTLDHFIRIFRDSEGITPTEFRSRPQKTP